MSDTHLGHEEFAADAAESGETCLKRCLAGFFGDEFLEGAPYLAAAFRYPDLKVVYLNRTGRALLCPNSIGDRPDAKFGLRDIVSVAEERRFESIVFPMLEAAGSWRGELELRDLLGGSIPAIGRFESRPGEEDRAGKILCLKAEPSSAADLVVARGWKERELLLALLEHSKDAIYFKDRNSRFLRASHSMIKRFGLKHPHEALGRTDFDFFDLEHAIATFQDEQRILETGEPILDKLEKEVWPDNSVAWVSSSKLPLRDAAGNIVGTFGISRDLTERRQLEGRLMLSQRLESIGTLAAGVAHEINTPAQYVSNNLDFLQGAFAGVERVLAAYDLLLETALRYPELRDEASRIFELQNEVELEFFRSEIPDTVAQCSEGLKQIARIVGSLKDFAYPSGVGMAQADVNRAVRNAINVARSEWKEVARTELELDPDLPEVPCRIDEINQALLNLVVNAAHAIADSGKGYGRIAARTRRIAAGVCIEIEDTGNGIPYEIRHRIFEPFFTTKEVGKGTGQGLALVRSVVVEAHGGEVEFESEIGKGSLFRLVLPLDRSGSGAEGEN